MAGEERDARLILSAEDKASRTFGDVAKAIKLVKERLNEQSEAARRGEGDLDAINASLKELRDLGNDLVKQQSVLNQFDKMAERVQKAQDRIDKATATLREYEAEVVKSGTRTDAQSAKLETLQQRVVNAETAFNKLSTQATVLSDRMERAGLVAGQFDAQTDQIAAAAREAAQGLATATAATDEFAAAQARAKAAGVVEARVQKFDAAAAVSPVSAEDIAFVRQFDDGLERLRQLESVIERERTVAAAAEAQRKAQQRADVAAAIAGNDALEAEFAQLARVEKEAAAVTAFRQIGTDAAAAASDLSRFGAQGSAGVNSVADAVRGLTSPAQQAFATLDGLKAKVDAAFDVASSEKAASDLNAYSRALGDLATAQRQLVASADLVDKFRAQEAATAAAEAKLAELSAETLRAASAVAAADGPTEELAADTKRAAAEMEAAGNAAQREREKLLALSAALQKAGIDSKNLANAEKEIISTSERVGVAADKLGQKQQGKGGFLGLNPYELQNLSYQINDVFTQLGSGTPVLQIVAQQGGQILQLFRGAIPFIIAWAAPLLAAGAALVFVGSAISRANKEAEALKTFKGVFAAMGDGAQYSAQQFAMASVALQDIGLKATEANDLLRQFVRDGLDPKGLDGFISTAQNMSKVTGEDVPTSFKLLSDAAKGGYDDIVKLNDSTGALTDTELAHIKTLIESGDAEGARAEALRITQERTGQAIAQMEGPLASATRGAALGWNNLLDAFRNIGATIKSYVQPWLNTVKNDLLNLATGFVYVTSRLKGLTEEQAKAAALGIQNPVRGNAAAGAASGPSREAADYLETQQKQLASAKLLTRAQERTLAAETARAAIAKTGANNAQQELAAKNAIAIVDAKFAKEDATKAKSAASAARSAQSKAEAAANRLRSAQQAAENAVAAMDSAVSKTQNQTLQERLDGVAEQYKKVYAQIDAYERAGGGKARAQALRDQVAANVVLLQQQAELSYREQELKDLTAARATELDAVKDAYARGEITAAQAITRAQDIQTKLAPGIAAAAQAAITFAESIAGANPPPALVAFIAQMKASLAENTGNGLGQALKATVDPVIATEGARLNAIIQQRNELVDAETALVKAGLQTRQQAQTNIEAGYAATKPLMDAQLQSMKDALATLNLTDPAMRLLYDTWAAKLQLIQVQSVPVDAAFVQLKNGIDQAITQNALQGFDDMAKALGALVAGGASVGDTFAAIGQAALNFVSQTLAAIAKLILQMIILDAIQKATRIPVAALTGGGGGGGGGGFFGNLIGGLFGKHHNGGIAGSPTQFGHYSPAMFAGVPRYHQGGLAGLQKNEVAAVLKKGEEVLTEDDDRHVANGGKKGGSGNSPVGLKQVLVMHPRDVAGAMQSSEGDDVQMTFIRNNRDTIRQELGV